MTNIYNAQSTYHGLILIGVSMNASNAEVNDKNQQRHNAHCPHAGAHYRAVANAEGVVGFCEK
jgi:hypothetical protein